jgi:hypothetical protein
MQDFLLLVQGSLDQIKPVLIMKEMELFDEKELKAHHFKFEKNKFIFLNYSIRNSLSAFDSSLLEVKSFDEIYNYFERNFQKS